MMDQEQLSGSLGGIRTVAQGSGDLQKFFLGRSLSGNQSQDIDGYRQWWQSVLGS